MERVNKQRLYWTLQIGGWALYAIIQISAVIYLTATGLTSQRLIFLIYEAIFCLLISHIFRELMNRWRWMILSMTRIVPRVVLSVMTMGLIMYFLRMPISIPLGLFKSNIAFNPLNVFGQSFFYAIIFFLWTILYFIYNYFERYNKSLKMEASVKEAELSNLKSQLNPHFIFNALNSIRALVDENPAKSKHAINQLSNLLRSSLVTEKKELTHFNEELKIVRDYLGLESIRFEERLKTEFHIDPASSDFLVPPLMVQTLVENGVKHGISKLTQGGVIQVKTEVKNDHLVISIRNSGHYLNGNKKRTGLGLTNTVQRLKLLYGENATFRIANESNNFVLTEIIIPHLYKPLN